MDSSEEKAYIVGVPFFSVERHPKTTTQKSSSSTTNTNNTFFKGRRGRHFEETLTTTLTTTLTLTTMAEGRGGGGQKNFNDFEAPTTLTTDACAVAVIAGRSLRDREAVHTRIRCALLAPGLVDAVAITDPAFGTDPVFRAELILPTTLRVETYTHLSVEMLDEEMTKVVGFGTMDFQELVVENKGKIPGKWIAMWDDARENVVGHVCIRVTLEVVDRKEKMKNGVLQTTPAAGVVETQTSNPLASGGAFEAGKHQISEGRKQLLNRFARSPRFKKPEEVTREAQETVNLKSRELEEEKKRREELEKQLEEMKREREEAAERERRERREKTPGGRATVSEIAHEYENLNKNNTSYTNNSTINRTPRGEERSMDNAEQAGDANNTTRSFLLDTSKVSIGPPLSPVRSSRNTSGANRSFLGEHTNQQQTKEQALRSLRQRGILTDVSTRERERGSKTFIRNPIRLVSKIANKSRRTVLKKFTTLRSIVQTIDPNVLVGAAIGLFLVGFRNSRSADEKDLRFVSIEDVDVSKRHQKLLEQQQQQQEEETGNNIEYFYADDPRGPVRRGEYEVKPGDSLCSTTGCVLPEKVEVRDADGNLVKYPDVIYPGDRITLFH